MKMTKSIFPVFYIVIPKLDKCTNVVGKNLFLRGGPSLRFTDKKHKKTNLFYWIISN